MLSFINRIFQDCLQKLFHQTIDQKGPADLLQHQILKGYQEYFLLLDQDRNPPARPFDLFTCPQQPQHVILQWKPAVLSRPCILDSSDQIMLKTDLYHQESVVTSSERTINLATPIKEPRDDYTENCEDFTFKPPVRTHPSTSSPRLSYDQQMQLKTGFSDAFQSTAIPNRVKPLQGTGYRAGCNTIFNPKSGDSLTQNSVRSQWSKQVNPIYFKNESKKNSPSSSSTSPLKLKHLWWIILPVSMLILSYLSYFPLASYFNRPHPNRLLPHSLTNQPISLDAHRSFVSSDPNSRSSANKDPNSSPSFHIEPSIPVGSQFIQTVSHHNVIQKSSSLNKESDQHASVAMQQPLEQQLQKLRKELQSLDDRQQNHVRNETHHLSEKLHQQLALRLQLLQKTFDQRLQRVVTLVKRNSCDCISKKLNSRIAESNASNEAHLVNNQITDSQLDEQIKYFLNQHLKEHMDEMQKQGVYMCNQMIQRKISQYDADKVGEANFASEASGAKVVESSPTSDKVFTRLYLFSLFPITTFSQPDWLLHPRPVSMYYGWFMEGSSGFVRILLGKPLLANSLIYEHLPAQIAVRQEHLTCTPKRIRIVGYDGLAYMPDFQYQDNGDQSSSNNQNTPSRTSSSSSSFTPPSTTPYDWKWSTLESSQSLGNSYELGEFEFNPPAAPEYPMVSFHLNRPVHVNLQQQIPVKYIELHVLNNYGNQDYTCLFKIRLTGVPVY